MDDKSDNIVKLFKKSKNPKPDSTPSINITENANVTIINGDININTSQPSAIQTPYRTALIQSILDGCNKRKKTVQKLTLWVLHIELNSLEGLPEFELQKLQLFLNEDN